MRCLKRRLLSNPGPPGGDASFRHVQSKKRSLRPFVLCEKLRRPNTFGANAALTATTNIVLGVLAVLSGALAARLLGPRGRGELAAIQTWPTLMGYIVLLGSDQAVVYFSAREPDRSGRYLGCAIVLALTVCAPFMAVTYAVMPWLLSAQAPTTVTAARWYLLVVPIIGITTLPFMALRGRSDFIAWNLMRVTPVLAWLVILIGARLHGDHDARLVAYAYLAALAALAVPICVVVRRRIPGGFLADIRLFKPILKYGLPCLASSFPMVLNLRLDQMLMAALLAPSMLGLYTAAVAWSGAINPLMNAIGTVLFPRVAGHGESADRLRSFAQGSRLAALVALVTTPVLTACTPWGLILLFGQKFQAAVLAALILVPAGAVAAMNVVIEEGLRGLGRPVAVMQAELAGVVTTGVSLYLLLGPLGVVGASVASILGYSTVMAVLLIHVRSLTGESPGALLLPGTAEVHLGIKYLTVLANRIVPAISS